MKGRRRRRKGGRRGGGTGSAIWRNDGPEVTHETTKGEGGAPRMGLSGEERLGSVKKSVERSVQPARSAGQELGETRRTQTGQDRVTSLIDANSQLDVISRLRSDFRA
jgi:hypothetical protein